MRSLLFPRKCVLCRKLLKKRETDLCHDCRCDAPELPVLKINIPFIAKWTAVWYYTGNVRQSIHRYKFLSRTGYRKFYARQLVRKLQEREMDSAFDLITWIPVSRRRKLKRGYDQSFLLAERVAAELNTRPVKLLKKIRHTKAQSSLKDAAARRANISGAYRAVNTEQIIGKRILLIDDILTTGATASECARTLLIAGATEVTFAAIAAASHDNSNKNR